MILPKTDISIMMVRNALDYPSTDLGTLCICDNVNMFSKYKPVIGNFTINRPSNWWKGPDGKCGIVIPSFGSNFTVIDSSTWTRQKPNGGERSPYRLGDFAEYNSDAMPIVSTKLKESIVVNRGDTPTWEFYPYVANLGAYNLSYDDIMLGDKPLGDCYIACQISYAGSNMYACCNSTIRNRGKMSVNLGAFPLNLINVDQKIRFFIVGEYFEQKTNWIIQDIQYILYADAENLTSLSFKITEVNAFVIIIDKIGSTLGTSSGSYIDPVYYNTESSALQLGIAGNVFLLCSFTNRKSAGYQVELSKLQGVSSNWYDEIFTTTVPQLYTVSGSPVTASTITIPANSTVDYVIRWNYSYRNGSQITPPSNKVIRGNIDFKYLVDSTPINVSVGQGAFYVKSSD